MGNFRKNNAFSFDAARQWIKEQSGFPADKKQIKIAALNWKTSLRFISF